MGIRYNHKYPTILFHKCEQEHFTRHVLDLFVTGINPAAKDSRSLCFLLQFILTIMVMRKRIFDLEPDIFNWIEVGSCLTISRGLAVISGKIVI